MNAQTPTTSFSPRNMNICMGIILSFCGILDMSVHDLQCALDGETGQLTELHQHNNEDQKHIHNNEDQNSLTEDSKEHCF